MRKEISLEEKDFSFGQKFTLHRGREGDFSNLLRQTDILEIHNSRKKCIDFCLHRYRCFKFKLTEYGLFGGC